MYSCLKSELLGTDLWVCGSRERFDNANAADWTTHPTGLCK